MSLEHKVRQIIKRTSVDGAGNSALGAPALAAFASGGRIWDFSTLAGHILPAGATLVDTPVVSAQLGKTVAKSIQFTVPAGSFLELAPPALAAGLPVPNKAVALAIELVDGVVGAGSAIVNWFVSSDNYTNYALLATKFSRIGAVVQTNLQGVTNEDFVQTGTLDFDNIINSRIRITNTAGAQPCTVIVHGIFVGSKAAPTVSIIHDDGSLSAYTELRPALDVYGFKAGYAIIGEVIDTFPLANMTSAHLRQLYKEGHDLIPHGIAALSSYPTVADALADIDKNREYLTSRGYSRGSNLFVYANGVSAYSSNDKTSIINHLQNNGIKTAWDASGRARSVLGGLDRMRVARYTMDNTLNPTNALDFIDKAVASGLSVTLMIHVITANAASNNTTRANLAAVLAGLATRQASGALRFVTPTQQAASWD